MSYNFLLKRKLFTLLNKKCNFHTSISFLYIDMTTDGVKKNQSVPADTIIAKIANALDAKDGTIDRQISKKEYNIFADYTGLAQTDKEFVSIDDAMVGLDQLVCNNPAKIVNYSRNYLDIKVKLHREDNELPQAKKRKRTSEPSDIMWKALVGGMLCTVNPGIGMAYTTGVLTKPTIDYSVGRYIEKHSISEVRETIRSCADMCSSRLPLASQLLHMSVTDSETTVGAHKGYRVHSPQQSKTRLAQLGMHENDRTAYGDVIDHFTTEQMKLKTVEFSKTSTAAKVMSDSKLVKLAIDVWEQEGRPQKKYYSGCMNDNFDEMLGINSCCLTVTGVTENGKTTTYTGYVEDIYDYAENYTNDEGIFSDSVDSLNKAAYKAQQKGAIKPYRVLIPFTVIVDKNK